MERSFKELRFLDILLKNQNGRIITDIYQKPSQNIPLTLFERIRKGYERFYCVRGELETEQNCNILTPTLLATAAFLSRSHGLLNRGPGAQHLLSNSPALPVAGVI